MRDLPAMVAAVSGDPLLSAPTVRALAEAVDGRWCWAAEAWMDREALA